MLEAICVYCKNMQNLENLDVFELITQKLLKCLKDPFVRSALIYNCQIDLLTLPSLVRTFFMILGEDLSLTNFYVIQLCYIPINFFCKFVKQIY